VTRTWICPCCKGRGEFGGRICRWCFGWAVRHWIKQAKAKEE